MVHPGRYMENLNLSNKNDVILTSLEYTTGDTTYVSSTVIDGSSDSTSTILCYENTVDCTIRGFSITGGSGYDYYNGTSPYQIFGGGIFMYLNCSLNLINLNIHANKASMGGGICILQSCVVSMSNVNIYDNIARYRGGGLHLGSGIDGIPVINFNQENRCSIYNNLAQWGMDIDWFVYNGGSVAVYLKKFTIPHWEKYFASYFDWDYPPSPYTVFDIQESYLQPIEADLFVSPTGNDNNSGLSPATALKSPTIAMQRIASDSSHAWTVHLSAGIHHNIINGEYLPISVKDYTILEGISSNQTRLVAENMIDGTGAISMGIESSGMTIKNLAISTTNCTAVFSWGVYNCTFENIVIENCTFNRWAFITGSDLSSITLNNIILNNNTATLSNYGFFLSGETISMTDVVMQNSHTEGMPVNWYDRNCGGFDIYVYGTMTMTNCKFINNTHYSEDGFSNFRINNFSTQDETVVNIDNCLFAANSTFGGARDIDFVDPNTLNITNCTFANNEDEYTDYLHIGSDFTRIVNCIFSNNDAFYDINTTENTYIENCLFSKSNNIWRTNSGVPLDWGDNNLIGTDPLFSGSDPSLQSYYYLFADATNGYSPAIDAGTIDPSILPVGYQIPDYDAFGNIRIHGNGIDIGCFESPGYTGNVDNVSLPIKPFILSNYPNPFNHNTTISYSLPKDGDVTVNIFNIKGQLVKKLVSESKKSGAYNVSWNGDDQAGKKASSGLYFARMETNGKALTTKMIMLK